MDFLSAQMQSENVLCSVLKRQLKDGLVRCVLLTIVDKKDSISSVLSIDLWLKRSILVLSAGPGTRVVCGRSFWTVIRHY